MNDWNRVGVFDLETTGLDVTQSRIVTAYVGILDERGDVMDSWSWVADPGIPIPDIAARVHGYTTERARAEGRPAGEVVPEIVERLSVLFADAVPVVAYNASYDFSLLHHDALRNGVAPLVDPKPIIDPLIIDKKVDTFRRGSRTLQAACDFYGVDLEGAHDSSADAVAAGRVFQAMRSEFRDAPEMALTPPELHDAQIEWARLQAESFARYLAQKGETTRRVGSGVWPVYRGTAGA